MLSDSDFRLPEKQKRDLIEVSIELDSGWSTVEVLRTCSPCPVHLPKTETNRM